VTAQVTAPSTPPVSSRSHADGSGAHRYDEFINGFAALMEARGVPRAAGRIFAYLQVCEPAEQTAAQLATALGMSLGTISGMTRLLMQPGWVERRSRRSERQAVFRTAAGTMSHLVDGMVEPTRRAREMTERGLRLMADRPGEARARLQELHDVYRFFELSLPELLERWHGERREEHR